ncbi:MAG: hypothetical protein HQ565_09080 [Bacteroidetes bacterium]|nr:hypothetical protein [Bacteroidota bacterium]
MKRHIAFSSGIILVFNLFLTDAMSQEGEVYVSIGAGVSIPLADYAKTDFSKESSGFAGIGGAFNINFGYRFNEYISLTGLLSGGVNRYDYIKLQDEMYKISADILPETKWAVEAKSWGTGGFLAGLTGSLPIVSNTFYIEARALAGFMYTYSPAIYITGTETAEEDKTINIEQSSAISWSIDAGLGLRYNRSRKQYFILNADYIYAQPYFKNVYTESSNITLLRDNEFTQIINTINITIGIGYIVN